MSNARCKPVRAGKEHDASRGSRAEFDGVDGLYLPIAAGVFAVVLIAIAFALVRYRARPGRAPRPTQDHYALDIGLALAIGVIVAVLLALGPMLMAAAQIATIAGRRAPGMTLLRMPVFTWSMLVHRRPDGGFEA